MQSITPVTEAQLLQSGQRPLLKLEIFVDPDWINICDLDSKNYVESISLSLSQSYSIRSGTWSAVINNENSIFHPNHPDSAYTDYFKANRKVKISVGAHYSGTDYYWQRIIGYMDQPVFDIRKFKFKINGLDYMKVLADMKFKKPDNYWGTTVTETMIASEEALGDELYDEKDAMDIDDDAENVTPWADTDASFDWAHDAGGGSDHVGELLLTATHGYALNENIGSVTAGKTYKFKFKYRRLSGHGEMIVGLYKTGTTKQMLIVDGLRSEATPFVEKVRYFTATKTAAVRMKIRGGISGSEWQIDQISLKEITGITNSGYALVSACNGPYYATIDGDPFYYRDEKKGWYHDRDNNIFYIENDREVAGGEDLVIHYFTDQVPENVIADILVLAKLYANQGAALAGMDYTATGITLDRVWFKAGNPLLDGIKKICERCNYRFYFNYNGVPVFKPAPIPKAPVVFTFLPQQIESPSHYQDMGKIFNRITIEGEEIAQPVGREDKMTSKLKGEASDATSITAYGEHTKAINNHLFQDQSSIDSMCATLLARDKDPKWYFNFNAPFNPAPLEISDTLYCHLRLAPSSGAEKKYATFKYGDGTKYGSNGIIVSQRILIQNVQASQFNMAYQCEKVV